MSLKNREDDECINIHVEGDQKHTISLIPSSSKVPSHSNQFCDCSASSCSTYIGIMGVTVKLMAFIVAFLGVVSFLLGVIAENKKPVSGTPITGKDGVTCKFPADPTVPLGYLSLAFLVASTLAGLLSVFYPYKGMSIPQDILFESVGFTTFFNIALLTTGSAAAMLLWTTISDQLHLKHKFHRNFSYTCPTATTGLLGGGAFLSLDSCVFWLIALLLAHNIREDFFEEVFGEKGKFGKGSKTYAEALKESI